MAVGHKELGLIDKLHFLPVLHYSLFRLITSLREEHVQGSVSLFYLNFMGTQINLVGDPVFLFSADSQLLLLTHSCFFMLVPKPKKTYLVPLVTRPGKDSGRQSHYPPCRPL